VCTLGYMFLSSIEAISNFFGMVALPTQAHVVANDFHQDED